MQILLQERRDEIVDRRVTLTKRDVVAAESRQAGCMRQQVSQSHLVALGPDITGRAEFGQHLDDRRIEAQQATVHTRHHCGCGHRLGDGRDAPQRVPRGGTFGLDVGEPPVALDDEVVAARDQERGTWHDPGVHPIADQTDGPLKSTLIDRARSHGLRIDIKHPAARHTARGPSPQDVLDGSQASFGNLGRILAPVRRIEGFEAPRARVST